ncbi:hypothetical protein TrRE_jg726 [Triparma retinervis]|uniref:Uncharacterized protein n=1 Tax=Triparma retinervis TaxID=2557542 RepID=A0A9W7F938_9STRA|nr:hypothetical protein TrRE_jg726 [Triparma retinervis]
MSRKAVPAVSEGRKEEKFHMDLQQHSRRMGWGMPGKHKRKPGKKDRKTKGRKKAGKQGKMPILHRASSSVNGGGASVNSTVHPNHGTLDSSAKTLEPLAKPPKEGGGQPWWENEFSSRNGSPTLPGAPKVLSGTAPLPPTLASGGEKQGDDAILGVTIGFVGADNVGEAERGKMVAFNPTDPLPGITPGADKGKEGDGEDKYDDDKDEEYSDDGSPNPIDFGLDPSSSMDPSLAMQMVSQNDPSNPQSSSHQQPPSTSQAKSDGSMQEFKLSQMVDAALFASWKALPWQTRVCPMALEERESVRLLATMVSEARRIRGWTKAQNSMAMDAATREDKRFAQWLTEERERISQHETREKARVTTFETKQKEEAKAFEKLEEERVENVEKQERTRMANWVITEFWEVYKATKEAYAASLPSSPTISSLDTAARLDHLRREESRSSKELHSEEMKLTLLGAEERALAQAMHEEEKDRAQTKDFEHARKTNAIWAAEVARATGEANTEDEQARERWLEEKTRVESEDAEEKGRVEAWETLQFKVMKAAMANVLRLLAPDTATVDFEDEVEKSKYFSGAYKKRCKLQKNKFQKQRYLAAKEAESTSRRWLGALRKWRDASVDVHDRRHNYERDRVASHMQAEVDRTNDARRKEQDSVAYAWDRECQRVNRWREKEKELFKDLATEWRRQNTEGEKFLHEIVQECGANVANAGNIVEERIQSAKEEHSQLHDSVKKGMEAVGGKSTEREREEREKVREFEGAQLLMVLGVSEQLTKIAGDSIVKFGESTEVKEATFIAAESAVSEEIDRFSKSENTRISAAYRMETERASKRAREEGAALEAEWEKVEGDLKRTCDGMNAKTEKFAKETQDWADGRGKDLAAKCGRWKEESEQVATNELLRMFGQEGFKRGMDIAEIPKPGRKNVRRIVTRTRTVKKDPEDEGAKGMRVEVFWESEDAWFEGEVDGYGVGGYHVLYDDGDEEWVAKSSKNYRFLEKVNDNEATRVSNRSNHELKDWGDYVSATTLTVRNNLNYIHGLRSSFNEWVENVHYKQRSEGLGTVRDLCKTCQETMHDVDKDVMSNLHVIENQFKTDTEGVAMKAEGKVHEEVNVVLEKVKEVKKNGGEVVGALAAELTSKLEAAQDEYDAAVQKAKVEVENAAGDVLRMMGDGLSQVTVAGDVDGAVEKVRVRAAEEAAKGVAELEAFAEKRKVNLVQLKDEVKGGVDDLAVKANEKIKGVLGNKQLLDDKFNNTATLVTDSTKVTSDKIAGLCKERSANVKARVQKYELQITLSLAEDLEALKAHGAEFQAAVKACPGNCDVDEELKVIESVNQRRKEGLEELEGITKRAMKEEVNKEDLSVNAHNSEHEKDIRNVWSDFGETFKEKRVEVEEAWKFKVEEAIVVIEQMKVDAEDGRVEDGLGLVEEFEHLVAESDMKSTKVFDDIVEEVETKKRKIEERVKARVAEVEGIKKRVEERIREEAAAKEAAEEARRQAAAAAGEGGGV